MRFEGTEKKLELVVSKDIGSLKDLGQSWWGNIVEVSGAKILSFLQNEHCMAYLLSESSLFVYDDFATMITCGDTSLVDAAFEILKFIPEDQIPLLFYERKNPIFPKDQTTNFYEDIKKLQSCFKGTAYRFGDLTEHHICLFHKNYKGSFSPQDMTLEILMHDIDKDIQPCFCSKEHSAKIKSLGLHSLFSTDFQIDEYFFKPCGYSMNGIWENEYYTFHVTPNNLGSYVSFETNHKFTDDYQKTLQIVLSIFKPSLFDIFQFQVPHTPKTGDFYQSKRKIRKQLNFGYDIEFYNFYKKQEGDVEPFQITP